MHVVQPFNAAFSCFFYLLLVSVIILVFYWGARGGVVGNFLLELEKGKSSEKKRVFA